MDFYSASYCYCCSTFRSEKSNAFENKKYYFHYCVLNVNVKSLSSWYFMRSFPTLFYFGSPISFLLNALWALLCICHDANANTFASPTFTHMLTHVYQTNPELKRTSLSTMSYLATENAVAAA
jgi:hypothetical protein